MQHERLVYINEAKASFLKVYFTQKRLKELDKPEIKIKVREKIGTKVHKIGEAVVFPRSLFADEHVLPYLLMLVENIQVMNYNDLYKTPTTHLPLEENIVQLLLKSKFNTVGDIVEIMDIEEGRDLFLAIEGISHLTLLAIITSLLEYGVPTSRFANSFNLYLFGVLKSEGMLKAKLPAEQVKKLEEEWKEFEHSLK